MNPGIRVDVTAGVLAAMSDVQFAALRDNVLADGHWDHVPDDYVLHVSGHGDYVGVHLPNLFVGIEKKDGYTHS